MSDRSLVLNAISRNPSLYETVSDQLLTAIRDAGLTPGTRIPSERELGEQFGVSRTVIREAIRHLAAKGVLQVISGAGVNVADLGHEGISESIELFLRQRGAIRTADIHEVRESLELKIVELAATRASDEQLQEILDICEEMSARLDNPQEASRLDVAFHRKIAEATGNALFLVLIDSLGEVLFTIRRKTLDNPGRGAVALEAHRAVARALQKRDAAGAVQAMRDHLAESLDYINSVLDRPTL
jgi:GntR family transcriptional repressor for pyruvate dehydrogenase complex